MKPLLLPSLFVLLTVSLAAHAESARTFDVRETVHEVVDMLRPSIKFQRHQLSVEIPEGLLVESFPGPLGQVVMNLVSNAMVHGLEGRKGGLMQLSAERLDGERLPIRNAPPTLGEGTREVLQQLLQLSEQELQALQAKGVLTLPGTRHN